MSQTPGQTRRVIELAACYLPLNERHLVVELSAQPVLKIEHLGLLSSVSSVGSCLGLLRSLLEGRLTIDEMLAAHITDGDAQDRFWPLLAASGRRLDHRWTRFWSSEQMILALSLYADNAVELGRMAQHTSGGWSPRIFESIKMHAIPLRWHLDRALCVSSGVLAHLRDTVVSVVQPRMLTFLLSGNPMKVEHLADIIQGFDCDDLSDLLSGTAAAEIARAIADIPDSKSLLSTSLPPAAVREIAIACNVPAEKGIFDLAAALHGSLSVRDKLHAARALLT